MFPSVINRAKAYINHDITSEKEPSEKNEKPYAEWYWTRYRRPHY